MSLLDDDIVICEKALANTKLSLPVLSSLPFEIPQRILSYVQTNGDNMTAVFEPYMFELKVETSNEEKLVRVKPDRFGVLVAESFVNGFVTNVIITDTVGELNEFCITHLGRGII